MPRCRALIRAKVIFVSFRWGTWIIAVFVDLVALGKVTVILIVNARAGLTVYRLPARMYVVPIPLDI